MYLRFLDTSFQALTVLVEFALVATGFLLNLGE